MSSYIQNASCHGEELLEMMTYDDGKALCGDLISIGEKAWLEWDDQHRHEANDFLRSTPKQHLKKKWQDPILKRRLILSAYRQSRLALSILHAASYLGPSGSYRDTTAAAADAALQVLVEAIWRWPFGGEPPFGWDYYD